MTEVEVRRKEIRTAIEKDVEGFSSETIWGPKPNADVIEIGKKFCYEMIESIGAFDDVDRASQLAFFSNAVVRVFVASTRYYEKIGTEELEAIGKIFDDLRVIRTDFVNGSEFGLIFEKAMYVREIFLTNTIKREDYDCKYRQSMIFPNFCDVYEIVHKIVRNWDKLTQSDDFNLMFISFRKVWYKTEINPNDDGDIMLDKIHGWSGPKPETAKQDVDPRYWAREFLKMLDEHIK